MWRKIVIILPLHIVHSLSLPLEGNMLLYTFFVSVDLCLLPDMLLSVPTVEKYIEVVSTGMATRIQRMQQ
jgi:hypothetical protein